MCGWVGRIRYAQGMLGEYAVSSARRYRETGLSVALSWRCAFQEEEPVMRSISKPSL